MEPARCRLSCSLTVQYFWDAILFIKNQKQTPNMERIVHHLKRIYRLNESDVKKQLKYALSDGLLIVEHKVGNKGARMGLEQDSYRLPEEALEKPSHDWYCFECHRSGDLVPCTNCHRVYHSFCIRDKAKKTRTFTCRICKMLAANGNLKMRREDLNVLLGYTCKRLKAFPHQMGEDFGLRQLVFDHKDDWRHAYLIHQYMDLVTMEKKTRERKYRLLEEFEADAQNVVHNVVVYHGVHSTIATMANQMLRDCIYDLAEIRQCSSCYRLSNQKSDPLWFCRLCDPPHQLVYAKQIGFPHWPAKVVKVTDGVYDVRFFGGLHQRANINEKNIKPIESNVHNLCIKRSIAWNRAVEELKMHQKLLASAASDKRSSSCTRSVIDFESEQSDDEPQCKKPVLMSDRKPSEPCIETPLRRPSTAAGKGEVESGSGVVLEQRLRDVRLKSKLADLPMQSPSRQVMSSGCGDEPAIMWPPLRLARKLKDEETAIQSPSRLSTTPGCEKDREGFRPPSRLAKNLSDGKTASQNRSGPTTTADGRNDPKGAMPLLSLAKNLSDGRNASRSPSRPSTTADGGNEPDVRRPPSRLAKRLNDERTASRSPSRPSSTADGGNDPKGVMPLSSLTKNLSDERNASRSPSRPSTTADGGNESDVRRPPSRLAKRLNDERTASRSPSRPPMTADGGNEPDLRRPSSRLAKKLNDERTASRSPSRPSTTADGGNEPDVRRPSSRLAKKLNDERTASRSPSRPSTTADGGIEPEMRRPPSRLAKKLNDERTASRSPSRPSTTADGEIEPDVRRPPSRLAKKLNDKRTTSRSPSRPSAIADGGNEPEVRRPSSRLARKLIDESTAIWSRSLPTTTADYGKDSEGMKLPSRLAKNLSDEKTASRSPSQWSTTADDGSEPEAGRMPLRLVDKLKDEMCATQSPSRQTKFVSCGNDPEGLITPSRPVKNVGDETTASQSPSQPSTTADDGSEPKVRRAPSRLGNEKTAIQSPSGPSTTGDCRKDSDGMRPPSRLAKNLSDEKTASASWPATVADGGNEPEVRRPPSRLAKRLNDEKTANRSPSRPSTTADGGNEPKRTRLAEKRDDENAQKNEAALSMEYEEEEEEEVEEPRITRSASRLGQRIKEAHLIGGQLGTVVHDEESRAVRPASRLGKKIKETVAERTEDDEPIGTQSSTAACSEESRAARPASRLGKRYKEAAVSKALIQSSTVAECEELAKFVRPGSGPANTSNDGPARTAEIDGEVVPKNDSSITSSKQTSSADDYNVVSSSSPEMPISKNSVATQTRPPTKRLSTKGCQTELDGEQNSRSLARAQAKAELEMKLKAEEDLKLAKEKLTRDLTQKLEKKYADDKERAVGAAMARAKAELESTHLEMDERCTTNHAQEIQTINQRHQHMISEIKKKQWCYNCEAEAIYHCCWNTSYCSIECQQIHWQKEHKRSCRRKR